MTKIILASQSPQRKAIFATLGLPFTIVPADIDEQAISAVTQHERAKKIALAKALAVQKLHSDAIIIAGDTYVVDGSRALEKPRTLEEAKEMLEYQSGRTLEAITGVCYLDPHKSIHYLDTVSTKFTFRQLSSTEIDRYVQTQSILTWSAAFCPAYDEGMGLVASSEGSFTSFTHGLPIEIIAEQLRISGLL